MKATRDFTQTCFGRWGMKPDLIKVEASEGDAMVSIDKYFDKFVYRGEEKDRIAVEESKENGDVLLLFLFKLEKFERFKS